MNMATCQVLELVASSSSVDWQAHICRQAYYGWLAAMNPGIPGQCCVLAAGTSEKGMPGYSYEPSDLSGWIWNWDRSVGSLGRAYNYPHQVCVCCIQPLHSLAACALCSLLLLHSEATSQSEARCAVPEGAS